MKIVVLAVLAAVGLLFAVLLGYAVRHVLNGEPLHTEDGTVDRDSEPFTYWALAVIGVGTLVGVFGFTLYLFVYGILE